MPDHLALRYSAQADLIVPDFRRSVTPDTPGADTALALALLRHLPDIAILTDPDGRVTLVNGAGFAALAPAPGDHLPGRFLWDLWPPAAADSLRAALAALEPGDCTRLTLACPGPGDAAAGFRLILCPIESGDGRIAKVLCIAHPEGVH